MTRERNSRHGRALAALLALATGLCGGGLPAAEAADLVSDDWQFQVTPYLWALSIDADVTVRGIESSQSVTFSDILSDLSFALMMEGEARKGRLGVYADVIYSNLSDTDSAGGIRIRSDADAVWAGLGAYYRFGPWPLLPDGGPSGPVVVVDPYAGARYTYLNAELKVRGGGPQVEQDKHWVDPIIGLRTIWVLTPRWSLTALGDIGGFGVGSDLTWQAAGLIGYRFGLFGDKDARFQAGYRALYQKYDTGSGGNAFKWDATLHGPALALAIDF